VTSNWLPRALEESRARGFLGPGEILPHINHALGFAKVWSELSASPPTSFLDLGSGGGLPGLVLLDHWRTQGVFVDAMVKRTRFLEEVLSWDGAPIEGAYSVVTGRAEEVARLPHLREQAHLVVCRSFGPPAVTAECATGFIGLDGFLIVSEPPGTPQRWDPKGLKALGLELVRVSVEAAGYALFQKTQTVSDIYPRPNGVPGKKPLF
jgi:16S rRNA (guanine527-N7)-methyltransferase